MTVRSASMASVLLVVAAGLAASSARALAQNVTFDLEMGGKVIGHDTYSISKAKNGFKLTSHYSYHVNGVEFSLSNDFRLNDGYRFVEGGSSDIASQMHTSYAANKAQNELTLSTMQAGVMDSRHLQVKPGFVLLPAYDAGAAQAMLLLATTHPSPDNLYNLVVPGSKSSPPPSDQNPEMGSSGGGAGGNFAYDALWTKSADTTGTLDGKSVHVHTYTLKAGNDTWLFFADDANNLLECKVSMAHANYVRAKFHLQEAP